MLDPEDSYGFFEYIEENHKDVYIGNTYYEWEQIAPLFEKKTSFNPDSQATENKG